jgi:hypothetical protein
MTGSALDSRETYRNERIRPAALERAVQHAASRLREALERGFSGGGDVDERRRYRKELTGHLDRVCDAFLPAFAKADLLASRYQDRYARGAIAIYLLAAFSVVVVAAQFLFELPSWTISFEIAAMLAILAIITLGNRVGWQRRWTDYRLLAERLRSALFMAFLGEGAVRELPQNDFYREPPTGWWGAPEFAAVWAAWTAGGHATPEGPGRLETLKAFLKEAWLCGQANYHRMRGEQHRRSHHVLSAAGEALFALTLAAAVLHLLHVGGHALGALWTFCAIVFPVCGSAFAALRAHFEHNRHARRARAMVAHMEEALGELERAASTKALLQAARRVEAMMLEERSGWRVSVGLHKLEPPA